MNLSKKILLSGIKDKERQSLKWVMLKSRISVPGKKSIMLRLVELAAWTAGAHNFWWPHCRGH